MELEYSLTRAAVCTVVNKALRDIVNDTDRSVRNFVDIGSHFAKSAVQKDFFTRAHDIVACPQNPYNRMIRRMLKTVDNDTAKTVGVNFGYTCLTYGVGKLRENEKKQNHSLPWVLWFDFSDHDVISTARRRVDEGQKLGIYCYIADNVKDSAALISALRLASENPDAVFLFAVYPHVITETLCAKMKAVKNIAFAIYADDESEEDDASAVFPLLSKDKLLFGFLTRYDQKQQNYLSDDALNDMIRSGCLFGTYCCKVPFQSETAVYQFVRDARDSGGKPILLFDFYKDLDWISEQISAGASVLHFEKEHTVSYRTRQVPGIDLKNALTGIIARLAPIQK